jgi:DNA segregation ATPase FtsK/SpoIIIE-like protein
MFKNKQIINRIKQTLLAHEFKGGYILSLSTSPDVYVLQIQLPPSKEIEDLKLILNNLKEELKAHDVKIQETSGKRVTILFGKRDLSNINYNKNLIHPNTLQIELPSSYGSHILDFEDGVSCHMLNGGAPRMGKTTFLLYLTTMLYIQNPNKIHLYITSVKGKDFYPLMNLPNVQVSDENEDELTFLEKLLTLQTEYKRRNTLLYSPALEKATDSKSVKKLYPHMYHHFYPIFVVIDEYARFNKKEIHNLVAELVQTAGYVNVHVIIATQRPDARQTLPAKIKMGLMTRICFRTSDENNSIVILDEKGAESLTKKEGRAILKDGEKEMVQIPFITYQQCEVLLNPFKKEIKSNDNPLKETSERPTNNEVTNKIQNMFKEPNSNDFI